MLDFTGSLIIRNIVGRCSIWDSYQQVIWYTISRLQEKFDGYRALSVAEKASFVKAIITEHNKNRELYGYVMGGI